MTGSQKVEFKRIEVNNKMYEINNLGDVYLLKWNDET